MKSKLVFSAVETIGNRYLLCRLTSKTVRSFHCLSMSTEDAIVDALELIGRGERIDQQAGVAVRP